MNKTLPATGGCVEQIIGGANEEAAIFRNRIDESEDKLVVTGKNFYVSQNGNDNNDGTSPQKAFRTLKRVTQLEDSLKAGDGVFLERGSVFRTSADFELVSGVTYGAYGEGKKPEVYGSEKNYAEEGLWILTESSNIWKMNFPQTDAGIIVLDGGRKTGKKQLNLNELTENDDFYHDWDKNILYFYSDCGNPGVVFSEMEIGIKTRIFHMSAESHDITVDNISFSYTGLFGVRSDGNAKNITITNCAFSWIGGSLFNNKSNRFGNGIEFAAGCEDITVKNCSFDQIFDSGVTFQIGDAPYRNFTVEDCLFEYNGMSGFEWWTKGDQGEKDGIPIDVTVIENISIKNNLIRLTGYGWSKATRSPAHIRNGWRDKFYPNMKNFVIKDNVFDCVDGQIIASVWKKAPEGYRVCNNTYYQGKNVDASNYEELVCTVGAVDKSPQKIEWISIL